MEWPSLFLTCPVLACRDADHPVSASEHECQYDYLRLTDANRLHCVTERSSSRYKLRIEDVTGKPLIDFIKLSRADAAWSVQLSTFAGQTHKENYSVLNDGGEDYRLPIVNERISGERHSAEAIEYVRSFRQKARRTSEC
jgi:hypothetical protein